MDRRGVILQLVLRSLLLLPLLGVACTDAECGGACGYREDHALVVAPTIYFHRWGPAEVLGAVQVAAVRTRLTCVDLPMVEVKNTGSSRLGALSGAAIEVELSAGVTCVADVDYMGDDGAVLCSAQIAFPIEPGLLTWLQSGLEYGMPEEFYPPTLLGLKSFDGRCFGPGVTLWLGYGQTDPSNPILP